MSYVRMTRDERNLMRSYARLHSVSVSDALKSALLEKIEDEYDTAIASQDYKAWSNGTLQTISVDDFKKEFDL